MIKCQGVIPILATPFRSVDEGLDLESWQRLLEFLVACGVLLMFLRPEQPAMEPRH